MRSYRCRYNEFPQPHCRTPLIEICDSTTRIELDLGSCGICATTPTALLLRKGGCVEWETICVPTEPPSCGCCPGVPDHQIISRPVPKPAVLYPLHEIDPNGMSVFVLDGKLKEFGYGRYHGVIMLGEQETDLRLDVDYVPYRLGVAGINIRSARSDLQEC